MMGLGASIIPREGDTDPKPPLRVKIEDVKLDHNQIDRLTSGVTLDVPSAVDEVR